MSGPVYYELKHVFDGSKYPDLTPVLLSKVGGIRIEFTGAQGVVKPHVELRLILQSPVSISEAGERKQVLACSIGSNPGLLDNRDDDEATTVTLRTQRFAGQHNECFASFRFDVSKPNSTVMNYLNVLRGNESHPDLIRFQSVTHTIEERFQDGRPGRRRQFIDGCRDLVAQWMVRLNQKAMVGWHAAAVTTSYDGFLGSPPPLQFSRFIAKHYSTQRRLIVTRDNIPMYRGIFLDPSFARVNRYETFELPYTPMAQDLSFP